MGFEPMIRVLQTLALPLGHVARDELFLILDTRLLTGNSQSAIYLSPSWIIRAGDGTRTHDLLLGKETFYQLNHARALSSGWSMKILTWVFSRVNPSKLKGSLLWEK